MYLNPFHKLFTDTRPEEEEQVIELLRSMSAAEKLRLVCGLNATVRKLAIHGLRERYPHASSVEIRRRLADLQLGPELAAKVYGPLEQQPSSPLDELRAEKILQRLIEGSE